MEIVAENTIYLHLAVAAISNVEQGDDDDK